MRPPCCCSPEVTFTLWESGGTVCCTFLAPVFGCAQAVPSMGTCYVALVLEWPSGVNVLFCEDWCCPSQVANGVKRRLNRLQEVHRAAGWSSACSCASCAASMSRHRGRSSLAIACWMTCCVFVLRLSIAVGTNTDAIVTVPLSVIPRTTASSSSDLCAVCLEPVAPHLADIR